MLLTQFDYEIIELFVVDVVGQGVVNHYVLLKNLQFGYKVDVFVEGFGYFDHPSSGRKMDTTRACLLARSSPSRGAKTNCACGTMIHGCAEEDLLWHCLNANWNKL